MVQAQRRRPSDEAVGSSVVAFLVAGVLFIASVVAVLVTTRDSTSQEAVGDPLTGARLNVQAASLADLLLDSPGYLSSGAEFGQNLAVAYDGRIANADQVTRLGLLDPDALEPFMMDFGKFQNLRQAPFSPAAAADCDRDGTVEAGEGDCYVNYEEARTQFGLDEQGLDFHIRSYPNLRSYAELFAEHERDQALKVAYVADATAYTDDAAPYGNGLELRNPGGVGVGVCRIVDDAVPAGFRTDNGDLACATVDGTATGALTNPFSCAATTKGFSIATVVHNAGANQTRFKGVFDLRFGNSDRESQTQYSHPVAPGGTTTLFVDMAALSGRSCSNLQVSLGLYDPDQQIVQVSRPSGSFAAVSPAPTTIGKGLVLKLTGGVWEHTDRIDFSYSGPANNNKVLLVICPGEAECGGTGANEVRVLQTVPSQDKDRTFAIDNDLAIGPYTARLYFNSDGDAEYESSEFRSTLRFNVVPDGFEYDPYTASTYVAPTEGNYDASSAVSVEVSYIEELMGRFCPFWFDSATSSPITGQVYATRCGWRDMVDDAAVDDSPYHHKGDVYSTDGTDLKRNIEDRLYDDSTDCDNDGDTSDAVTCWTDILVIGSEVDHEKLTNGQVKGAVKDWVYAGGTLIVFGSAYQKTEWLQSIFHTALEGGEHGNGVSVPDEGHPVLNVPNDLAWDAYRHTYAWRLKETGSFNAEEAFTRVVNEDGGTPTDPPNTVLAVGDPGDFGLGNVIITGWTPWDLEVDGATTSPLRDEGRMLVHNLLMLGYADLYLDYGPELPEQANVVPAVRSVQICHPDFDVASTPLCEDPISMAMQVYVFRGRGAASA